MCWQVFVTPPAVPALGQWRSSGCHAAGHPQGGTASDWSQPWGQCEASQQHDPGQGPSQAPLVPVHLHFGHSRALGTVLLAKKVSRLGFWSGGRYYFVGVLKNGRLVITFHLT